MDRYDYIEAIKEEVYESDYSSLHNCFGEYEEFDKLEHLIHLLFDVGLFTDGEEEETEYKITAVTPYYYPAVDEYDDDELIGYKVALTETGNPFDAVVKKVKLEAFNKDEFKVGRVIKIKGEL